MAGLQARLYAQFNFLIDLGTGRSGPHAGFQECSGLGLDMTAAEHDTAGSKQPKVRKITVINKSTDVTLKRGVIRSLDFKHWLDQSRGGGDSAYRTITITLQNEHHESVQTWTLLRARIIKHVSGPFNAKATDVAIEELSIACERIEMK